MTTNSDSTNFQGQRIAAFESRMSAEMERMISRHAGVPFISASMREVAVEQQHDVLNFANAVLTGQVDVVIWMTGVGFKQLLDMVVRNVSQERFMDGLRDITTIARGPKPVAALREAGLTPTLRVPEPNTWRELLDTIDASLSILNSRVVLQEYGISNSSLIAGLEARGAQVWNLKVYEWKLPDDLGPLQANVRRIAAGELDAVMFTSGHQARNVLEIARQLELEGAVRERLREVVVASIGPTTSEVLRDLGLPVDFEPSHSKMGNLVSELATHCQRILDRKRRVAKVLSRPSSAEPFLGHSKRPLSIRSGEEVPAAEVPLPEWYNSPFMKACRREPAPYTPIWMMRQAGRYMAEYREVRAKTTFLELCKNPKLCAEVMVTAVDRLGVDAAIIFSDLLPILEPMGLDLEFAKGEGPVIHNPVRDSADIDRVLALENVDSLHFVMETVSQTRAALPQHIPLIGFAGAPFTLASYMIEGGSSRNYLHTKTLMYRDAGAWQALMQRLVHSITIYLNAQIRCGAQAVQIFDSWVGCLGPDDYRTYVLPYLQQVIEGLDQGVPVINFATGNPALLPLLTQSGGDVIGVDWRIRLDAAWREIGYDKAIQGNLDPLVLLADRNTLQKRAEDLLKQAQGRPGHIFNLGHGILPQTSVEQARALVEIVQSSSRR